MKNTKSARITQSSVLLLTISLLMFPYLFVVKGQGRATLENTEWETNPIIFNGYGLQSVFTFRFLKNGNINCTGVLAMPDRYDPMTRQFLSGFKHEYQFTGNYAQTGNSVNFNCKDYKVNASIANNKMDGEINIEGANYNFTATQVSGNRVSSSSTVNNSTSQNNTVNAPSSNKVNAKETSRSGGISPEARKIFESLSRGTEQLEPNEYQYKAMDLMRKRKYQEAFENYTKAINLISSERPVLPLKLANAYAERATVRFELEDYRGVIEDCNKYTQSGYYRTNIASLRGNAKLKLGDYEGAITDYDKVIQFESSTRAEQKQEQESRKVGFNLGLITIPDSELAVIYNNRGYAKERVGDKDGACEDYRMSCTLGNSIACKSILKICNQ